MTTVNVPDTETIYYISLLINKGWKLEDNKWIHPSGKTVEKTTTEYNCFVFFDKNIQVNEWTLDEAIDEVRWE